MFAWNRERAVVSPACRVAAQAGEGTAARRRVVAAPRRGIIEAEGQVPAPMS